MSTIQNITSIDLQVFQLYSKDNKLKIIDLLKCLRFLGHQIDEDSIYNITKDLKLNNELTFDEFSDLNIKIKKYSIKENNIRKSFEYFDQKKTGFIDISILEKLFPLTKGDPSDLEELIRLLGEDDLGRINYESFLRRVYGDDS